MRCFVKKNGGNESKDKGPSLAWFREGSLEEVTINRVPKVGRVDQHFSRGDLEMKEKEEVRTSGLLHVLFPPVETSPTPLLCESLGDS